MQDHMTVAISCTIQSTHATKTHIQGKRLHVTHKKRLHVAQLVLSFISTSEHSLKRVSIHSILVKIMHITRAALSYSLLGIKW